MIIKVFSYHRDMSGRTRGQAIVEFALTAPLLLVFFVAITQFWLQFQRQTTYSLAAQTLAEFVARNGQYNPTMATPIINMLDEAFGVGSRGAYLSIMVIDPTNQTVLASIGEPVPPPPNGQPPAPSDEGWNGSINTIPHGMMIQVDIWGYHEIGIPRTMIELWTVPNGHSVMPQLSGASS